MKITMSIKDKEFMFEYFIGNEEHHGRLSLSPEHLHAFSEVITFIEKYRKERTSEDVKELQTWSYLEKNHPDLLKIITERRIEKSAKEAGWERAK